MFGAIARVLTGRSYATDEPRIVRTRPTQTPYQAKTDEEIWAAANGYGFMSSEDAPVYTDVDARDDLNHILRATGSPEAKYDALRVLEIKIGNWADSGMSSRVLNDVEAAKYECVKEMQS